MRLQSVREGSAPAAVMLRGVSTGAECDAIASAYENLAYALPHLGDREIKGKERTPALSAWAALASWTQVVRVLAGWIRAFGFGSSRRCELCYRHRATKKRCGEHIAKSGITPAVRLARAIQPAYIEMAGRFRRAGHAKAREVSESEWRSFEQDARDLNVPEPLLRQCCILAVQLRRMYSSIGPALEVEVSRLFVELARHATEQYERAEMSRTRRASDAFAGIHVGAMLNLRIFFTVWCANGRPYPRTAPNVYGRRHDPAHPLVRGAAALEQDIAGSLAHQQAWHLAYDAHHDRLNVDGSTVAKLLREGLSFDSIAARYGFSHETARQIYKRGDRPRIRARVKLYDAKGRQRFPGAGVCLPQGKARD